LAIWYIRRPAGRVYLPTVRVAIFSDWLKPALSANLWTERLNDLRGKTRETVAVGRRQRNHVHYVQILLASEEIQVYMREGTKRPLCASASGRAILSSLSDPAVLRIVRRYNDELKTKALRIDEGYLLDCVQNVRRTGISETDPRLDGERGIHAIATLMPRKIEPEHFSLCVVGPKERILKRKAELIDTLRKWMAAGGDRSR
jgi:DNA-binding IclR family transcriptional regulator